MTSDFGVRDVFGEGLTEASEQVHGSRFMFLPLDVCHDPDWGQI